MPANHDGIVFIELVEPLEITIFFFLYLYPPKMAFIEAATLKFKEFLFS